MILKKLSGKPLYAKVVVNAKAFTVTKYDTITMHRLTDTRVGDLIQLDQVYEVGSKEYVVKGKPFISPQWLDIKARVIENGRGARQVAEGRITQRKGRRKKVSIKPHITMLRIEELAVISKASETLS